MNRPDNTQAVLDARAQAAEWHVRLHADDASEGDFAAFEVWVARPGNREAYDAVEALAAEVVSRRDEIRQALDEPFSRHKGYVPSRRVWIGGAAAAAAAVAAIAVFWPASWVTYSSGAAPRAIVLSDGTKIVLNRKSSIEVAMRSDVRRIRMHDAEASFVVAHNAARPFVIDIGDRVVRVVGTEFNVLNDSARTVVSVREGAVRVSASRFASSGETHVLTKGDQLVHSVNEGQDIVRKVDPQSIFAWQSGHLVYNDAKLRDVVADLGRYFAIPIRVADERTGNLPFSGVLTVDSEDAVVGRLVEFLQVDASRSQGAIVLRTKAVP